MTTYKTLFYKTLKISVFFQILTALFEFYSLFIKVPSEFIIINGTKDQNIMIEK